VTAGCKDRGFARYSDDVGCGCEIGCVAEPVKVFRRSRVSRLVWHEKMQIEGDDLNACRGSFEGTDSQ